MASIVCVLGDLSDDVLAGVRNNRLPICYDRDAIATVLHEIAAMQILKIVLLCILSAIIYGVLHDQVTARVCVEYFTVGHPPVFHTQVPTFLAFGWGVIATWWMGLVLSVPATLVCRVGSWPKLDAAKLIRPIAVLLFVMACASLVAGIAGYYKASAGQISLTGYLASRVPIARHNLFLADLWAHRTAYGVGFFGGLVLCVWVLFKRWTLARTARTP